MSSEASSEQSCVREGTGYDEMFLAGQDDPYTSYDERVLSTNSPSTNEDGDLDVDRSEGDSNNDDLDIGEPQIQSVIGPNGFREFIMLLLWTINDFNSSIKQQHFNTLREKYQIPVGIPMRLPFKREKCYYKGAEDFITLALSVMTWTTFSCPISFIASFNTPAI